MNLKDVIPQNYLLELNAFNRNYGGSGDELNIAAVMLRDERFFEWSGASKPHQHHYGKHGLMVHTHEVIKICFSVNETTGNHVDKREIFWSALFHDAGKMFDYKPTNPEKTEWDGSEHKRRIHHISRSALIWSESVKKWGTPETVAIYHDRVLHNILSHHGCREWGSPVSPDTKAAWLLHLSDNLSARLYETL
jgi:3'-5' exoribonuclease